MSVDKKELYDKLSSLKMKDLKTININQEEIDFIKNRLLNNRLGLILNWNEVDEELKNNYFGLKEIKELNINPRETNNHLIIEGDNYYGLKAILPRGGGTIDVIYIDPPYNTGNKDFTYNDSYVSADDNHKHSKWLSFMKKRLLLAKELLKDNGVIFVSIDDHEQAYLKILMDEIFGEENFIANLIWHARRGGGNDAKNIAVDHEYILCYAKNIILCNLIGIIKTGSDFKLEDEYVNKRGKYNLQQFDRASLTYTISLDYPIECPDGSFLYPGHVDKNEWINRRKNLASRNDWRWMMSEETFLNAKDKDFIVFEFNESKKIWNVRVKNYQNVSYKDDDYNIERYIKLRSVLNNDFGITRNGNNDIDLLGLKNSFSYPKPVLLVKNLLKYFNNKNATVLDFFAGSGTTAQAVMELNQEDNGNRRFIVITKNENNIATDICRERIYRVINGKGSNNEPIKWAYSDEIKSLTNNHVKYLKVEPINKYDGEFEDINNMKPLYKNEFNIDDLNIKDFER